jgi:hypothetical protein
MHARNIFRTALTWMVLFGLYLILTGQASTDEMAAGAAVAMAGTILSVAIRIGPGHAFQLPPGTWMRPMVQALASVPRDTALVGWHLVRPRPCPGQLETEPLRPTGVCPASDHAVQVLAASFAPNRFTVALVQRDRMLMHRLAGGSPRRRA